MLQSLTLLPPPSLIRTVRLQRQVKRRLDAEPGAELNDPLGVIRVSGRLAGVVIERVLEKEVTAAWRTACR